MREKLTLSGQEIAQPKAEIAEMVRTSGIPVPQIFPDLEEARQVASGGMQVIVRSESPDEYGGASGLRRSFILPSQTSERADFDNYFGFDHWVNSAMGGLKARELFELKDLITASFSQGAPYEYIKPALDAMDLATGLSKYFRLQDFSWEDVQLKLSQLGHSFWQHKPGVLQTVAFDSVIRERVHIRTFEPKTRQTSFETYEGGANISRVGMYEPSLLERLSPQAIELACAVRDLDFLQTNGATNAPMIETVTGEDGVCNFLQYHPCRERTLAPGELMEKNNVTFVRGSLALQEITVYRGPVFGENPHLKARDFEDPFAFIFQEDDHAFNEWLLERAQAVIIPATDMRAVVKKMRGHLGISTIFKPPLTLIVPEGGMNLGEKTHDWRGIWSRAVVGGDGDQGLYREHTQI